MYFQFQSKRPYLFFIDIKNIKEAFIFMIAVDLIDLNRLYKKSDVKFYLDNMKSTPTL